MMIYIDGILMEVWINAMDQEEKKVIFHFMRVSTDYPF